VNHAEFADLKRRMDEDCHRVAHVARTREKKAATLKKARKVSFKKFVEMETYKP
jgi:hypothetical protein